MSKKTEFVTIPWIHFPQGWRSDDPWDQWPHFSRRGRNGRFAITASRSSTRTSPRTRWLHRYGQAEKKMIITQSYLNYLHIFFCKLIKSVKPRPSKFEQSRNTANWSFSLSLHFEKHLSLPWRRLMFSGSSWAEFWYQAFPLLWLRLLWVGRVRSSQRRGHSAIEE